MKELSIISSLPVYRIIISCLSTTVDFVRFIQQLQPY